MKKLLIILYLIAPFSSDFLNLGICQNSDSRHIQYVNPFIGTGGHGHTFPGPTMPFGACQVGPDTRLSGWDGCSGYHYSDSVIYGFSHTHLSGTGCSDYGDVLLMPVSRETLLDNYQYQSAFSHQREVAKAGYYQVYLDNNKVNVELTSTLHGGVHRYTYENADQMYVVLDLKHRDEVLNSRMVKIDDYTIEGFRYSKAWATNQKVFYRITFSHKIESIQYEPVKRGSLTMPTQLDKSLHCIIKFEPSSTQKSNTTSTSQKSNPVAVMAKVTISGVDEAGAEKNMKAEMTHWNFEQYRRDAENKWESELSKIEIKQFDDKQGMKTGNTNQMVIFYTALYHCMIHPSLYSDVDGRYRGRDDLIHNTAGKFNYYTVFSLWDTYRGLHPLLSMIDKQRTNDFISTFIKQYEQGGRLPIWELSSNETNCMIGYHVVSVIWDAYQKGIRNYDTELAFKAMKSIATDYNDYTSLKGKLILKEAARKKCADADALESYCNYGYVRADDSHESVSKTLEYAYDDWCIAQMAKALSKTTDYNYYIKRSQQWMNVYDPTTGFMRARKNGILYQPFSPYTVDNNYTEANSWQYSFYAPHDIFKLIEMHGGNEKFETDLDQLFSAKEQTEGREQADITGLIGQYAHGNEPSHQLTYLYKYIGKPEKTQHLVDSILEHFYLNSPDGLIGNEDCGQMSAWYVLNAIGMYSVCPGTPFMAAILPQFKTVDIQLASQHLHLDRDQNIEENKYKTMAKYTKNKLLNTQKNKVSNNDTLIFEHPTSTVEIKPNLLSYHFVANDKIQVKPCWIDFECDQSNTIIGIEKEVKNPFIQSPHACFKDSISVSLLKNGKLGDIYYNLNASGFKKYLKPISIRSNSSIEFYTQYKFKKELDYLNEDCSLRKKYIKDTLIKSPIQIASFTKLPVGVHVALKSEFNPSYSAGGAEAMIDGIKGKLNWRAGDWQGYQGQDVETIIHFDQEKSIQSLSANFLEDQNSWIFYPKSVAFYTSVDGDHWTLVNTVQTNKSSHEEKTTMSTFAVKCQSKGVRYIKMIAQNFGAMPEWHEGRGNPTFIFVDEIMWK